MLEEEYATEEMDNILKIADEYEIGEDGIVELRTEECSNKRYLYLVSEKDGETKSAIFLQHERLLVSISGDAEALAEEMGLLC